MSILLYRLLVDTRLRPISPELKVTYCLFSEELSQSLKNLLLIVFVYFIYLFDRDITQTRAKS